MININLKKIDKGYLKKALYASIALFCVSFAVQFYLCNRFAVKNDSLKGALEQRKSLEKEIAQLRYENSLLTSLDYVEGEAKEMGFVEMDQNLLTVGPVTVASLVNH